MTPADRGSTQTTGPAARFRVVVSPGCVVWIAEAYATELEPLRLSEPGALGRWRDRAEPVPGGRARGWRIPLPSGRCVHLRELAHGGWLRGITGRRFFGVARATASLEAAATLRERGVRVPAPVAMHARKQGPFWYLAVANEFIDEAVAGGRFLLEERDADRARRAAAAAGVAIRALHDAGARHPDLHIDNLLVHAEAGAFDVTIVDLDGVRLGEQPSPARRQQELLRLRRSLRKLAVDDAARTTFLEALVEAYERA